MGESGGRRIGVLRSVGLRDQHLIWASKDKSLEISEANQSLMHFWLVKTLKCAEKYLISGSRVKLYVV